LYQRLPEDIRTENPLLSGCEDMIQRVGVSPEYGHEMVKWLQPLFRKESPRHQCLRHAACLLSEIARYDNTEYRAEMAYRRILDSSLIGLDHKDRIFLAKAVYYRYRIETGKEIKEAIQALLSANELKDVRTIGYGLRLAHSLAGGVEGILPLSTLSIKDEKLILTLKSDASNLLGESIERRLLSLADWLDLTPVIRS
jgi:exopolyphosphatase/guanosine-5'-triphosphate,3'-diphosphate pyrophosphatase